MLISQRFAIPRTFVASALPPSCNRIPVPVSALKINIYFDGCARFYGSIICLLAFNAKCLTKWLPDKSKWGFKCYGFGSSPISSRRFKCSSPHMLSPTAGWLTASLRAGIGIVCFTFGHMLIKWLNMLIELWFYGAWPAEQVARGCAAGRCKVRKKTCQQHE